MLRPLTRTAHPLRYLQNHSHIRHASSVSIHRIAGSLGAELHGVDSTALTPESVKSIRSALLQHQVIFLRGQSLLFDPSPSAFLKFASQFGKPITYPFVKGLPEHPEIITVLKKEHETNNFGGIWHSDTSYLDVPPMGTILLAKEIPQYGGDTLFASQTAAYEALSPGLKKVLKDLKGINTSAKADTTKTREDRVKDSGSTPQNHEASHPVVRTHPETGQKSLYVNIAHTARFEGWSEEESAPLLQYLFSHQVRPEFTCRWRWEVGSVAFWDNRTVLHNPVNDYQGMRRECLRVTLQGTKPV